MNCPNLDYVISGKYDLQVTKKIRYLTNSYSPKKQRKPIEVYFVLASDGLVKIGRSTNVKKRITNLSVLHPSFRLLGTVKDKTEKEVHDIFTEYRVKGEWYRYTNFMIDFIETCNSTAQ